MDTSVTTQGPKGHKVQGSTSEVVSAHFCTKKAIARKSQNSCIALIKKIK